VTKVGPHGYSHGWVKEGMPTSDASDKEATARLRAATSGLKSEMPYGKGTQLPPGPHRDAMERYTDPNSGINEALRSGKHDEHADNISKIDEAIAGSSLGGKTTLYRGLTADPDTLSKLTPGAEFSDSAFVSTTYNPATAARFAVARAFGKTSAASVADVPALGGKPVVMRITVPKGGHAVLGSQAVNEYVLPRDSKFKVTSVSEDGSLIDVTAS